MKKILFSWVGTADLNDIETNPPEGSLAQIVLAERYQKVCLLFDQPQATIELFVGHLKALFQDKIHPKPAELQSLFILRTSFRAFPGRL